MERSHRARPNLSSWLPRGLHVSQLPPACTTRPTALGVQMRRERKGKKEGWLEKRVQLRYQQRPHATLFITQPRSLGVATLFCTVLRNGCVPESDGVAGVSSTGRAHAACRTPAQASIIKLADDHEAMQIAPTGGIAVEKIRSHNVRGFRGGSP